MIQDRREMRGCSKGDDAKVKRLKPKVQVRRWPAELIHRPGWRHR